MGRIRTSEKCSHCFNGERYGGGSWCLECRRECGRAYNRMRFDVGEREARDYGRELLKRKTEELGKIEDRILLIAKSGADYTGELIDLMAKTDDFLRIRINNENKAT